MTDAMIDPTDLKALLSASLEDHAADDWDDNELVDGRYQAVWYCPCGEMVPLGDFNAHVTAAQAAVVANWIRFAAAFEHQGSTADVLVALADKAVR